MDFESISAIRNVDRRIAALAAHNSDVVANWQLRRIGVNRSMVSRRLVDGFMRRIGSQEFVVGPAASRPLTDRARRGLGIVHAGRRGGALARGSAAAQLGFLDRGDGTIHVVSSSRVRDIPEHRIVYHQSNSLSGDVIVVGQEPTTRPTRTIVDLGFDHTRYQIVRAMCVARDRDRLDIARIESLLDVRRGCPGTAEVVAALALLEDGCSGTRGRAEDYLLEGVLRSTRLPVPDVCNRRKLGIGGIEPDLAWTDVGLVVFADGRPHTWTDVLEKDAQEMSMLQNCGTTALRFGNRRIWNSRARVVADIEDAYLALRSASLGPGRLYAGAPTVGRAIGQGR